MDPLTEEQRATFKRNLRMLHGPQGPPVITIFVRHSASCKYRGDEFYKGCKCRKHLRWSSGGEQHRKQAGTRSWAAAEEVKRRLEDQLAGRKPDPDAAASVQTIRAAVDSFITGKEGQGISTDVVERNKRELYRFAAFAEERGIFTITAVTLPLLMEYRGTWTETYPSSVTRALVQKRLRGFLRYCVDSGWLDRAPKLTPIKMDAPPTMPLTDAEYQALLAAAPLEFPNGLGKRLRAVIQIMRWTGLAVRDAVTLCRDQLLCDSEKKTYRIVTSRQKTGTHVSVPIPADVAEEALAACDHPVYLLWQNTKEGTARQAGHSTSIALTKIFNRAGIRTLGHMKSHRLRDTFAVDLLQKGVPLEDVSKMLGHTSVATTERHYSAWVKGRQDRLDSLVMGTWSAQTQGRLERGS
jgi:integrase/recombinase XerD